MRRRVKHQLAVAVAVVASLIAVAPYAAADGGGRDGSGESSQNAGAELLESSADVVAEDGSDLGPVDRARSGGGHVVCRYHNEFVGLVEPSQPQPSELAAREAAGIPNYYTRICTDSATGEFVSMREDVVLCWVCANPEVEPVDPFDLAVMARSRLPFPTPEIAFAPPLEDPEDFLLVRLPTWIWAENWTGASRTASAGAVTATVTATPVGLEWDFTPGRYDPDSEGSCPGPGTAWDPALDGSAQSTACSHTFLHSSSGEADGVFDGRITVVYEITWTSNIGAGGSLGTVRRTAAIPVPVGEQLALNESGGTDQ